MIDIYNKWLNSNYYYFYKLVLEYVKTGKRFILMRRFREEISSEKIEQYFQDVNIFEITNGKANCITVFKKGIYFSFYDNETGKIKRFDKIGYVVALSTEQKDDKDVK